MVQSATECFVMTLTTCHKSAALASATASFVLNTRVTMCTYDVFLLLVSPVVRCNTLRADDCGSRAVLEKVAK